MYNYARQHKKVALLVLLFIVFLITMLVWLLRDETFATLQEMNMEVKETKLLPIHSGEAWQPGAKDAEGFAAVMENDKLAFRMNPETTQFTITDKSNQKVWRSNPGEAELANETVKGLLLSNLKSTFILEFYSTDGEALARRELTNTMSQKAEKSFVKYNNGFQVTYDFTDREIEVVLQYELTDQGLEVSIPVEGIKEKGLFAVYGLELLPFMGAAQPGEDGYIFVPDGPGGLIRFERDRTSVAQGYNNQIYGKELSISVSSNKVRRERRETITYPVYGLKQDDNSFVAIIKRGEPNTNIKSLPAGLKSTFYSVSAEFSYREEYLRRQSKNTAAQPIRTVEKEMLRADRTVEFRFLQGDQSDYVGMAGAYRSYMEEHQMLGAKLAPVKNIPMNLSIMGGNIGESFNQFRYTPATTFPQAETIIQSLHKSGVADMRVIYYGWQNEGDLNTAKRFPIERKLGGADAARSFVKTAHGLGYKVLFEENFTSIDSESSLSAKKFGSRGIDETVYYTFWGDYMLKPAITAASAYKSISKLKDIGVDGIHYNWLGEMIYRDYDPDHPTTREDTAEIYSNLLAYTKQEMGEAGVYRGNDYSVGGSSYILQAPLESSYDFMIDETVPFYPIVLHGYVSYSSVPGNLRADKQQDFLKAIEYGALPAFILTYENSRVLRNTWSDYIYSSKFDIWKDTVVEEYNQFDQFAGLYNQTIVGHKQTSTNVFETTYEDGSRVTVDYNTGKFRLEKGASQ